MWLDRFMVFICNLIVIYFGYNDFHTVFYHKSTFETTATDILNDVTWYKSFWFLSTEHRKPFHPKNCTWSVSPSIYNEIIQDRRRTCFIVVFGMRVLSKKNRRCLRTKDTQQARNVVLQHSGYFMLNCKIHLNGWRNALFCTINDTATIKLFTVSKIQFWIKLFSKLSTFVTRPDSCFVVRLSFFFLLFSSLHTDWPIFRTLFTIDVQPKMRIRAVQEVHYSSIPFDSSIYIDFIFKST